MRAKLGYHQAVLRALGAGLSVAAVVSAAAAAVAAPAVNQDSVKQQIDTIITEYVDRTKALGTDADPATIAKKELPAPEWGPRVRGEIVKDVSVQVSPDDLMRKTAAIALELALEDRGRCTDEGGKVCAGTAGSLTTRVALATVNDGKVTEITKTPAMTNRQQASELLDKDNCALAESKSAGDGKAKWSNKLFQLPSKTGGCGNPDAVAAFATRDGKLEALLAPGYYVRQALVILLTHGEVKHYDKLGATAPAPQTTTTAAKPAPGTTATTVPTTKAPAADPASNSLVDGFKKLQLAGSAAVRIAPVGGSGSPIALGENWPAGPAWSTIKVPLAVAALRKNGSVADVRAAITQSDNDAAKRLWAALGSGDKAGEAVEAVLRDGGDNTSVQRKEVRPPYTPFGQTDWSPENQLKFAAKLPCINKGSDVMNLMGEVIAAQDWGLGKLNDSKIKGGWGPDTSDKYLVRQLAVVNVKGGQVAIVAAVKPSSGQFEAGIKMLNTIGEWLKTNADQLPGGKCG